MARIDSNKTDSSRFSRRSCRRSPHLRNHRRPARARHLRRVRAPAASGASGFRAGPISGGRPGTNGPVSNLASSLVWSLASRSCRSRQPSRVHWGGRRQDATEWRQLKRPAPSIRAKREMDLNPAPGATGQLAGMSEPESAKSRPFRAKAAILTPISARFSRSDGASKLAQEGGLWQISARLVGPSWRPILVPAHAAVAQW